MTRADRAGRRRFLAGALATAGVAASSDLARLFALAQNAANPRRIDIHHHFAPPAWVTAVKGRPLLQAANTAWTPEKSIDDMDKGGCAAAVVSITNPLSIAAKRFGSSSRCRARPDVCSFAAVS